MDINSEYEYGSGSGSRRKKSLRILDNSDIVIKIQKVLERQIYHQTERYESKPSELGFLIEKNF